MEHPDEEMTSTINRVFDHIYEQIGRSDAELQFYTFKQMKHDAAETGLDPVQFAGILDEITFMSVFYLWKVNKLQSSQEQKQNTPITK